MTGSRPGEGVYADLACEECQRVTEHEFRYAGRLLEGARCTECGNGIEMTSRALVPAYLHDLEQRISSKPFRLMVRLRQDPHRFLRRLLPAIARQPRKLLRELRELLR